MFHFMDHRNWSSVFNLLAGNQTPHWDQADFRDFVGGKISTFIEFSLWPLFFFNNFLGT